MAAISSINRRAFLAALVAACGLPKLAGSLQPAEPECEWCFKMFGPKLAALRPPEPELWRPCISHDELGQYVNHAVNNARREREKAAKRRRLRAAEAYRTGTLGDVGFDWYEQLPPAEPECELCFELYGHYDGT